MFSLIFYPFFLRALAAGLMMASICGPVGCLLVWRRMAFLGDALAHGAIFGAVISVLLKIDTFLGVIATCFLLAILLAKTRPKTSLPYDTWLAIISSLALALSVLTLSQFPTFRVDMNSLLFGDILAVSHADLWLMGVMVILLWLFFIKNWSALLMVTLDEELALTSGINVERLKIYMMMAFALSVAVGLRVMGALLLPAILIIPAACAYYCAKSPEKMVLSATFFSIGMVIIGLMSSVYYNVPSGPAIVVSGGIFLLFSNIYTFKKK